MSLRTVWSTENTPGQQGLPNHTLSQNTETKLESVAKGNKLRCLRKFQVRHLQVSVPGRFSRSKDDGKGRDGKEN